jgi:Fe-S-cluster containining protein
MIVIDPKTRLLNFPHACLDALPFCHAVCCCHWEVGVLASEFKSGKYKAEIVCSWDQKVCAGKVPDCIQRRYRLQKKEDKSCIYLADNCTCSIYEDRPKVCRAFSCANGWQLSSVASLPNVVLLPADASTNPYAGELHHRVVFMHNPLMSLKTLFYSADLKEMVLITKPAAKCKVTSLKVELDAGPLTEEQIQGCYALFDGTTGMEDVETEAEKLGISRKTASQLAMKFFEVNLLTPVIS